MQQEGELNRVSVQIVLEVLSLSDQVWVFHHTRLLTLGAHAQRGLL